MHLIVFVLVLAKLGRVVVFPPYFSFFLCFLLLLLCVEVVLDRGCYFITLRFEVGLILCEALKRVQDDRKEKEAKSL